LTKREARHSFLLLKLHFEKHGLGSYDTGCVLCRVIKGPKEAEAEFMIFLRTEQALEIKSLATSKRKSLDTEHHRST
jgi:hypothetical protein